MVALVQDVDAATRPRLAWQPDKPVNPASLMKLVTTYAGARAARPGVDLDHAGLAAGPVADGVLQGNLVIKGSGDPKLVLERIWLLLRRVQQARRARDPRRHRARPQRLRVPAQTTRPTSTASRCGPTTRGADALLLNYSVGAARRSRPSPARGVATIAVDPPLAGVPRRRHACRSSAAPCDDWRGALQADFADPARMRFAGAFPVACGEKVWPVAYADPKSYDARAARRRSGPRSAASSTAACATARRRRRADLRDRARRRSPRSIRDINKFSNNVMAQQLFLTLGADAARRRHARGGARGAAPVAGASASARAAAPP